MATFDIGETVICSIEVKNDAGTLVDPSTSMMIQIEQTVPPSGIVITYAAMTKDAVGKYHYDFSTTTSSSGNYRATYKATDGTRITIEKDVFTLD